jgi:hypothetical protein
VSDGVAGSGVGGSVKELRGVGGMRVGVLWNVFWGVVDEG